VGAAPGRDRGPYAAQRARGEPQERGLPDYHDPTAGWAGAAPTYSALTLRLWLAGVGIVLSIAVGVLWIVIADMIWPAVLLFALAAVLIVDLVWVAHRKRRGEPG